VESSVVHDYCIAFRRLWQQYVLKPVFKKFAVGGLTVALNGKVFPCAPGADDVYALILLAPLYVFDLFPPWGTGVFPLQIGIYAAFVNVNTFFVWNPL
jgi:hypothetical protein